MRTLPDADPDISPSLPASEETAAVPTPLPGQDQAAKLPALAARIAVYGPAGDVPRVITLTQPGADQLTRALGNAVIEELDRLEARLPRQAVREVVDNLVHARCADPVITVLDGGNTLLVSDRGPGISEKERALLPGFTTAGDIERGTVRGVGAGLPLVREALAALEGSLEITDNLDGGTVVRLHVPDAVSPPAGAPAALPFPSLSERQLHALLLMVELGPVGPTRLASELAVSASTAYRDLVALQDLDLVSVDGAGHRQVTESALAYIQSVL
jgi:hypothetical protein